MSGLDPSQTGKMTSTLSAHGDRLPAAEQRHRDWPCSPTRPPKRAWRSPGAGLLGNSQPGFSLFEKQKPRRKQLPAASHLSARAAGTARRNDQQRSGRLRRPGRAGAAELDQNQAFGESQNASSAAVLLSGTTSLDPGSVRGIAQLVSSSVPGLQLSKVTITDASGQLLWPQARAAPAAPARASRKPSSATTRPRPRASTRCSPRRVGQGKAQVLVYANMNVDQTTKESLEYGKKGVPLQQSKDARDAGRQRHGRRRHRHRQPPRRDRRAAASPTTSEKRPTPRSASRRSSPTPRLLPAPSKASTSRCCSTTPCPPPRCRRSGSGHQRRRHPDQARRHDLDRPGRLRQGAGRRRGCRRRHARRRQVRDAWAGRRAVPVLHAPDRCASARRSVIEEPVWLRELEAPMRLSELERENAPRPR